MNELLAIAFGLIPVYVIAGACLWYTERSIVKAIAWPLVAIYRTFGG